MKVTKVKKGVMLGILLVAVIAVVGTTYSRYISNATVNTSVDIAKWSIKLNGTDISTAPTTKQVALTFAENSFVKDNTLAPGTQATFDIVLDPTDSEVAVDYTISIDTEGITGITDTDSNIAVTGARYVIDGQEQQAASINGSDIVINESLADVLEGNKVTITVDLEWQEAAEDEADTVNGVAGGTVTVPVSVTAAQHI